MSNLFDYEVVIVDSFRTITTKISDNLALVVNERLSRAGARKRIRDQVRTALRTVIKASPTYQELSTPGTELYHEMGVIGSRGILESLIDVWSDSVAVSVSRFRRVGTSGIYGVIGIYGVKADFSDVLGMPGTEFISYNMKGEEHQVPWLEWLLFKGRSFVTPQHVFVRGGAPWSRTGDGLMRKVKSGRSWQVPSAHAGTRNNNWITRAIDGKDGGPGIHPYVRMIVQGVLN